jgi:ABC-type multidrug transport system ATPase subunit
MLERSSITTDLNELSIKDITFNYPRKEKLFEGFSLGFNRGDFVFILGENGSGKSTFLKLVLGAVAPSSGSVTYQERLFKNERERAQTIGYVPQSGGIDPEMSLSDMLDFIAQSHHLSGEPFRQRKQQVIHSLGLSDILYENAKKLSGGQQQLISITLGLIHDPEIVLLDEPFVGLDYGTRSKMIAYLKSTGKTILCVSHDIDLAQSSADKVLFLEKGKRREYASPNEIIQAHPYFVAEVDLIPEMEVNLPKMDRIRIRRHHNRITITCPDSFEFTDHVNDLLKQWETMIFGLKTYHRNLKSTLIGRYQLSFSDRTEKNKKRHEKK